MSEQDCNKDTEASIKGYGIEARAKGYRTADLAALLIMVMVGACIYMVWGHEQEAKAARSEIRKSLADISQSNMFLACIVASPEQSRMREFAGENSFCSRMAKMK